MVWIKICGITNKDDARGVAAAGADALGFVFAPSPRKIAPDTVREIIAGLPPDIEKIGLFVNEDAATVKDIAKYCGLTGVQLYGEENIEYYRELKSHFGLSVIKVIRVGACEEEKLISNLLEIDSPETGCLDRILLDTYVPGKMGGTGKSFSWETVSQWDWRGFPVIIAGGLNAGNVLQVIRMTKPYGIDVSSGVEQEPGKKDMTKVREFIETARGLRNG